MFDRLIELFRSGGPAMWPILALSVAALAVLAWKALEFMSGSRSGRGLGFVSTVITAEPLLGILGTVTGIMKTFGSLGADGGPASPLAATAGIGEALVTTAAGLVAALVLLFPYNALAGMAED